HTEKPRGLPCAAATKCAGEGLRRRSARLGPPSAVEEGPGTLHEETRRGSRGPRRVGAGEDDLTSPRRGDSALLGDGGRPDPRTRGRRGSAFSTDTRDGGERAEECRPRLVTVPGAGPHGDRTPRADPSLRESGDRGRTGDVQLRKLIDEGPEDYDPCVI